MPSDTTTLRAVFMDMKRYWFVYFGTLFAGGMCRDTGGWFVTVYCPDHPKGKLICDPFKTRSAGIAWLKEYHHV